MKYGFQPKFEYKLQLTGKKAMALYDILKRILGSEQALKEMAKSTLRDGSPEWYLEKRIEWIRKSATEFYNQLEDNLPKINTNHLGAYFTHDNQQ